jgi:hypothetical protein
MSKDMQTVEVEDPTYCMSFKEIKKLALDWLDATGYNNKYDTLNDESQDVFDQYFNQILADSYDIKIPKVKRKSLGNKSEQTPIINYNTFEEKMFMSDKYAKKMGYEKGTKEYAKCFIQCLDKHLVDVYCHSLTASGEINGKVKANPMIIVPNPTQKQTSALSPDIYEMFPDVLDAVKKTAKNKDDAEIKVNHLKSFLASGMKSLGENLFDIKNLEYPPKGTNEQLMEVEVERYKQLVVFVMVIVGVEAIVSVPPKTLNDLLERYMPVGNDGTYNWKMLHKTDTRQNFVKNIYNVLKNSGKMPDGTPKMLAQ